MRPALIGAQMHRGISQILKAVLYWNASVKAPSITHLVTVNTFVRPLSWVHAHVFVQTGGLRETFAAHGALAEKRGQKLHSRLKTLYWHGKFTKTLTPGHSSKRVLLCASLLCVKSYEHQCYGWQNNLYKWQYNVFCLFSIYPGCYSNTL